MSRRPLKNIVTDVTVKLAGIWRIMALKWITLIEPVVLMQIKLRWRMRRRWRKWFPTRQLAEPRIDYDLKGIKRVDLRLLRPGEVLVVCTMNSIYQIVVAPNGPPEAVAYADTDHFPEPRRVRLNGSMVDPSRSSIFAGQLIRGLHLELGLDNLRRVWTSPVKSVSISGLNVIDEISARDQQTDPKTGTLNLH